MAYNCDATNILATPLKNITGPCILSGITKIHEKLTKQGLTTKLHIMDNEVSEDPKKYFKTQLGFQLVPPHTHRRNTAKRAVITYKNNFIAALCTLDPIFPFCWWDHLLPQVTMTLNMLWQFRLNPRLSAYEEVDIIHNFEWAPLAPLEPLGCKLQIHEKYHKQITYAPHSVDVC